MASHWSVNVFERQSLVFKILNFLLLGKRKSFLNGPFPASFSSF